MTQPNEPIILPSTRRWPYLLAGLVLGVGGSIATNVALDSADDGESADSAVELQLATAPVEIRDLIEEVDWVGDLGYGNAVDVAGPVDGTVTSTVEPGTVLRRGDVVVEIDEIPVVVFYGTVPAWRDLADDDDGPDVLQLETNLVALGYDSDGLVTIDETYTASTADMVERWQDDMGLEVTGIFDAQTAIVVDGPVSVTTAPQIGDPARSGVTLASVSARAITTTVVADQIGQLSNLADLGTPIEHGSVLYLVGDTEVRALTSVTEVDGLAEDGIERAYVLVPEGRQVSAWLVDPNSVLTIGRPVLELSTQTLSVVIPVGLAEQGDWSVGQVVDIELPDESVVSGVVTEVGTTPQGGGQGADPTIDVIVEITELVDADLPASEVTVTVAGDSVFGATVVPTRALITLAEGGFAVEKVLEGDTSVLVAVETGAFDDGVVEITSSSLQPGDQLVVPQ